MAARIPYKWLVAAVYVLGLFMGLLDLTVTNVALPVMARAFGVSPAGVAWVTLGYLLPARGDTVAAEQAWAKLGVGPASPQPAGVFPNSRSLTPAPRSAGFALYPCCCRRSRRTPRPSLR